MKKQINIRKIPLFPTYTVDREGQVRVKSGRILKEKVCIKGAYVTLKKGNAFHVCYVRTLLQKIFKEPENFQLIAEFLESKRAGGLRVMWAKEETFMKCMVIYQGIGVMQKVTLKLRSLRDTKLIFEKFATKWIPFKHYKNGV